MFDSFPQCGHEFRVTGDWLLLLVFDNGDSFKCQRFAKWARAQLLLINASSDKRYGVKYSTWPFLLWVLGNPLFPIEFQIEVAQMLLASTPRERALFATQLLEVFNTVEKLLSAACHYVVNNAFVHHHYDSGLVENLNARTAHLATSYCHRGRSFVHARNEQVLGQLNAVPL